MKNPSYPSPDPIWILLPTVEGIAYAVGIAWDQSSFSHSTTGVSGFIGLIGAYSYSIYLLHFFVLFDASRLVNERLMDMSTFIFGVPLVGSLPFLDDAGRVSQLSLY